ncbi:MAG: hypothetical protein LBG84_00990 [Treponema sp.]|jgi:hypothetical protein|nr:hypothetical protein [Treponema sp.]
MKNLKKQIVLFVLPPLLCAACSTEAALQRIIGSSVESPVFYGCKAAAEGEVSFSFSVPVTVKSAYFDPPVEPVSRSDGQTVTFRFNSDLPGGGKLTADILVEDSRGNTLNVLVPFRTRNTQVPDVLISEIRTKNANMSKDNPQTEFVKLLIKSAGNLGALRLYAAGNNSGKGLAAPLIEFPPVMVQTGETVVVHTRTLPTQTGCVDETGSNLRESGGHEATLDRDFWLPGSAARLHNTDVIFIMDQDDKVLDGIVMCEKAEAWKNDVVRAAAMLEEQGAWNGSGADSALLTATLTTPNRTAKRINAPDTNSAADWHISNYTALKTKKS